MLFTVKVPSGLFGSAWELYRWMGLEKDINCYSFLIFLISVLNIWNNNKCWAASCKKASNPPVCSDHGVHVLKPQSFLPDRAPKMRERYQMFFGLWLVSNEFHYSAIQTKIEQHFGGIFHQIKVRQPIGRQDSMQTVIRTCMRLDSFPYEAAQSFKVF